MFCSSVFLRHSFLFVSAHQCESEVSEKSPSKHRVSFLEQHDFEKCSLGLYHRDYLSSFNNLDLGLLLFLLKNIVEVLAWGRSLHRFVHNGGYTAVLLARIRPYCTGIQIHCFTLECPPLLLWISLREFQNGGIVLRSSVSTIKRSQIQLPPAFNAYPMSIPGKTFVPN